MKLEFKKLKYYFLTYNNELRKEHMFKELEGFDLTAVETIPRVSKYKSGGLGISKILDLATKQLQNSLVFQPFGLLEDDVKQYRKFPEFIDVPDDVDILYLGLSNAGMTKDTQNYNVCIKNLEDYKDVIKLYNMLSSHSILICSIRGLLSIQKCAFEGFFTNRPWDIFYAQMQPFLNVYALKTPVLYQYLPIGGQEKGTKIDYKAKSDNIIPNNWINDKNITNITIFKD